MATAVLATGFEGWPDTPTVNGAGLCNTVNGTPAVVTSQANTGSRSLQINPSAATEYISWDITAGNQIMVGRFYFRLASLPTGGDIRLTSASTTAGGQIFIINTSGQLIAEPAGNAGDRQTGPTLSTGTWYRLDFRFITNGTNHTIDWQVGGTAQTQAITNDSPGAQDMTNFRLGTTLSATGDIFYDDFVLSFTSGDYPLGPGGTERLAPSADGTHNAGTNTIEDNAGTDIGTTTAYDKVNSVPPDSTAYIKQSATGTGNYAEVSLADISATHSAILAVNGRLAYTSSATQSNQGGCIISKDDFTNSYIIYGEPSIRADYSDGSTSNLYYKKVLITAWTSDADINAMKIRMGYSGDVTPNPYWIDTWTEVSYAIAAGTNYNQTVSGGVTPSGAIIKDGRKVVSGANTPSGTLSKLTSKSFSGGFTPSGQLLKQAIKAFTGAITPSGSFEKLLQKFFDGTLTSSGQIVRDISKTLGGTLTTNGTLSKQINKLLEGALSSISGTLTSTKTFIKDLVGTLTLSGTKTSQTNKSFTGDLTSSGAIEKQTNKSLAGSSTPSGAANKQTSKSFTGTQSFTGDILKQTQKLFSGSLTSTGNLLKQAQKVLSGNLTSAGNIIKQIEKTLSGNLDSVGNLIKQPQKLFSGSITPSGSILKQAQKIFSGSLTPVGNLIKQAQKLLSGNITLSGSILKQVGKILSGILTLAGEIAAQFVGGSQTYFKEIGGSLNPSGAIEKLISKLNAGTLTTSGIVSKDISKLLAGVLSFSGIVEASRAFVKSLGGTLTSSGTLLKTAGKNLTGSLSSGGTVSRAISKYLDGSLPMAGTINKYISRALNGILDFVGSLTKFIGLPISNVSKVYLQGSIIYTIDIEASTETTISLDGEKLNIISLLGTTH